MHLKSTWGRHCSRFFALSCTSSSRWAAFALRWQHTFLCMLRDLHSCMALARLRSPVVVPSYVWIHQILPWVYSRLSSPCLCTRDCALVLFLGYLKPLMGALSIWLCPVLCHHQQSVQGDPGFVCFAWMAGSQRFSSLGELNSQPYPC